MTVFTDWPWSRCSLRPVAVRCRRAEHLLDIGFVEALLGEPGHQPRAVTGQRDLVDVGDARQRLDDRIRAPLCGGVDGDDRRLVIAEERDLDPIDLDDLDHAATGREGDHVVPDAVALDVDPVGVRMRIVESGLADLDGRSRFAERRRTVGQARIVGIPARKPP